MKKILVVLLILPIIIQAQVRSGVYKFKLANDRLYMELFNSNAVRAADNCNITRIDCSTQAWEIIAVPGKPNTFHIVLVNGGKYLTWSNEPAVASRILLLPRYPVERIRFQSFLIIPNDKSSYDIQPALEGASANNYYLAAKLVSSGNNVVGIVNENTVDWTRGGFSISWLFTSSDIITRLPVQTAQPGVVSTPAPKVTPLPAQPVQPGVVSPTPPQPAQSTIITPLPAKPGVTTTAAVIKIETLTGGDDLRGGNDNLNVLIRLKIRPVRNITLNNINNRANWGNFTEHTVTRSISAPPFTFDDIEDIVLRHTGGSFGQGIDNWYLDKLKITLTIAGETKVLVDEVGAPIHYFKGDARSKTFQVLR